MASRPDPSLLVFISTIPQLPPLFKIRFIGWYVVQSPLSPPIQNDI